MRASRALVVQGLEPERIGPFAYIDNRVSQRYNRPPGVDYRIGGRRCTYN